MLKLLQLVRYALLLKPELLEQKSLLRILQLLVFQSLDQQMLQRLRVQARRVLEQLLLLILLLINSLMKLLLLTWLLLICILSHLTNARCYLALSKWLTTLL